jgi:cyclic pyranopterin phosphate synthase
MTVVVPVQLRRGAPAPMPTTGPLIDGFGRIHTDLRVSLTDRCNLRCVYCMPEEGMEFGPRDEVLTYPEITRVLSVARTLGIRTVRLTGGEPLLRRGIVEFVASLVQLGFEDIALTTNAMELARLAEPLARAGLKRVNISCDSLRPERFGEIRRRGDLATVLEAMGAAEVAGLRPVKVNVVLMAGVNDDEILDFAAFARATGRPVRFIEFMPLDAGHTWTKDLVIPSAVVIATINQVWPLERASTADDSSPAERFRFREGAGEIGVVATVTQPFCATCDRLRITADGHLRNCLFSEEEVSLREHLRAECDDEVIETALRRSVWDKRAGLGNDQMNLSRGRRTMSMIGG